MAALTYEDITVLDPTGGIIPGTFLVCECGGRAFHVFEAGDRLHLECTDCGITYSHEDRKKE